MPGWGIPGLFAMIWPASGYGTGFFGVPGLYEAPCINWSDSFDTKKVVNGPREGLVTEVKWKIW
ncbi:hypothetical protein TRIP_C20540 [Candidatus Zixiibacteriota bacterium]|nr:hypothetical protein TRIP_C20540 [candidate division Zixibacteria bacterium]